MQSVEIVILFDSDLSILQLEVKRSKIYGVSVHKAIVE